MFNIFKKNTYEPQINAATLQALLDEIVTPRLSMNGFAKKTNYSWRNEEVPFRENIAYMLLKGAAGTFTWGVNIDFIPVVRNNKLQYFKGKKYISHIWEGTDEYRNSFSGGNINKGIGSHWGLKKARGTIKDLFNRYEEKMLKWFEMADSVEKLTKIVQKQIEHTNFYNIHHPRPQYILAFLLAKAKNIEESLKVFEALVSHYFDDNENLKEKIREILFTLSKEN